MPSQRDSVAVFMSNPERPGADRLRVLFDDICRCSVCEVERREHAESVAPPVDTEDHT